MEALSSLLNGRQTVHIDQTDEQKELETKKLADLFIPEDIRRAMDLRPDLLDALTPEQRKSLEKGEQVALTIGDLPKDVKQKAMDFIKYSSDQLSSLNLDIDRSRMSEFQITIYPNEESPLSISGYVVGGRRIFY